MKTNTWALVIPYFNEEDYLERCLSCILHQSLRPVQVVLVNNASTDKSEAKAEEFKAKYQDILKIVLINEEIPGKIAALKTGTAQVETTHFAVWDADTYYPPSYLEHAQAAYKNSRTPPVAVMATSLKSSGISFKNCVRSVKIQILSRLYKSECHAGGYAETFDTAIYRAVGGFDEALWPYMFEDHEIVQRLLKKGSVRYPLGLWCVVSNRRSDRSRITWTKAEKYIYRYMPFCMKDWFFYSFLAPRFEKRGLNIVHLREQPWNKKR